MAKKKKKTNNRGAQQMSDKRFLSEKARSLPIYACYVTNNWERVGEAQVIVARERGNGNLCVGVFLCDAWCLGVKDAFGSVNMTKENFENNLIYRNHLLTECDYVYAHNLIYGSEAFAADADIKPAQEFALWGLILEEDTEDVPLLELEFGHNGKYHLIAMPNSKDALYIPRLQEKLGDDFTFEIGLGLAGFEDDDYYYDDDEEDDDEYEEDENEL